MFASITGTFMSILIITPWLLIIIVPFASLFIGTFYCINHFNNNSKEKQIVSLPVFIKYKTKKIFIMVKRRPKKYQVIVSSKIVPKHTFSKDCKHHFKTKAHPRHN